jgi:hypothetical protein
MQIIGGITSLTLLRNSAARGVTLVVECSQDLGSWTPLATSVNGGPPTGPATISEGTGLLRTLNVQHVRGPGHYFYRTRVESP